MMNQEKERGRPALKPGPVLHILGVTVHPNKTEHDPVVIYGHIYADFRHSLYGNEVRVDIYKRERNNPEKLDTSSGALKLNGPKFSTNPDEAYVPLFRSCITAHLFYGDGTVFAKEQFCLDDLEINTCYEQVKSVTTFSQEGSITVCYVAIPYAVNCRVEIKFYDRQLSENVGIMNVSGKIGASFLNSCGNNTSEETLLFKKQGNEFEKVEGNGFELELSRCWVSLPAYSSIVVGVDLSEFGSGRKIVNNAVILEAQQGMMSGDMIMLDDTCIQVNVAWFSPTPFATLNDECATLSPVMSIDEDMDAQIESEDEPSSEDESSSKKLSTTWELRPHKTKPLPSAAIEIFSVFIGGDTSSNATKVYGSIEVVSGGCTICDIFRRAENDGLSLFEAIKLIPVLDGPREFNDFSPLEIKFDVKEVKGCLAIKGYDELSVRELDRRCDQQLSSFVQGDNAFATVHYSIFSYAVAANIKVSLNLNTAFPGFYPVYGSLTSELSGFDYSSRYSKDRYRVVLFRRAEDKAAQLNGDGWIPLSRTILVVPLYSSLVVNLDLYVGMSGLKLSGVGEIEIGESFKTIKTDDVHFRIHVEWSQIK